MRQNTLQDPFLLHNFSSLYVAVWHVCTCPYGTSVFLLGATVYFGTGALATLGTHPLASLTGRKPPRSPSLLLALGLQMCTPGFVCVYRCLGIWSRVLMILHPVLYQWAISPALKLDSYLIFFKFIQCETDLHKHWNLTSLSSLACLLHRIRFP